MIIRALDENHDFTFGKGRENYLRDQKAIILNIDTRLRCFLNDCWFNKQAGIDWLRLLGTKSTKEEIELSCRAVIVQSYGIVRMNRLSADFDTMRRRLALEYDTDSIFSKNSINKLEVTNV